MAGGGAAGDSNLESPLLAAAATASHHAGSGHGAEAVSGQLESILSDDASLPWARRMSAATLLEMRLLLRLAAPAVLVYMINYLMSMSTQILTGHLGTLELAAASLGNTGIQIFAYGLMVRATPLTGLLPPAPLTASPSPSLRFAALLVSTRHALVI
jgi:MATE family multidrug resistance protein